jgi:mRNA-degrading endonuclease toxin of MazEF toxin-antitoxin module
MNRGDVVLVRFPHPSGARGKKRPAVVVQADVYNQAVNTVVVAQVTKNLMLAGDAACLFIDMNTPDGQATGLVRNSVVSCLLLATIDRNRVDQVVGTRSSAMVMGLNDCLKAALEVA